ncbi:MULTISPECIES: carbohydrate ABC transporter permease [Deinococcus]|uniref:Carbohydrate ABC transporter permease n=1 Tax=Deinococcus rufus TaxID=2136097 RepID=A0ABV7ZBG9_9DEIO|nr:sugar ABC transporter permease [Deinococcus sp. AB2017081]WQE97312.1 sugar ABC transporter permease [Deinococcus sp. AB2017081]
MQKVVPSAHAARRVPARGAWSQRLQPYFYVVPAALFVTLFMLYPMVSTLWQSVTDANGLNAPRFVGLANYRAFLADPNTLNALRNSLLWVVGAVTLPVGLGFAFALLLERLPGAALFKSSVFLPYTISGTVAAILFGYVLDANNGLLNLLLQWLGLGSLTHRWLFESPQNTWSMIAAYTWQATGTNLMIFLIGLQGLPNEPLEAAKIDGASGWTYTRRILIPMLSPFITINVLMAAINGFKTFDLIWVMTQGGPARTSETLAVTMYRESFALFHQGYGAAIAVVISVIALVFSYSYLRTTFRQEAS